MTRKITRAVAAITTGQAEVVYLGNLDALAVNVELKPAASVDDGQRSALARRLAETVKNTVGVSITVRVLDENQVPRSQGKAQRVVDKRNA